MSAAVIRCDNCDIPPHRYLWSCETCDQSLCQSCELEWHRPAKLASHPRERIEAPVLISSSLPLSSSSSSASAKIRPASAVKRATPAQPDEQVYCVCRQPDDGKRMMINCNSCDEWYHVRCVGLTEQEAEMLFTYKCAACSKANKKALPETNMPLLPAGNDSAKFRLLDALPHDLLFHTLSFVGSQQLANLSILNRHANRTFSHPLVWEQFLLVRYRTYAALSVAANSMGLGSNLDFDNTDFRYLARRLSEAPSGTIAQLQLEQLALENKQLAQRLQDQQTMQQRIKRRQDDIRQSLR